jgi:hypothetical protein
LIEQFVECGGPLGTQVKRRHRRTSPRLHLTTQRTTRTGQSRRERPRE